MKRSIFLVCVFALLGCNDNRGGGSEPVNGPPSVQPAPAPTAVDSLSPLARVPAKVRDQFLKDHPKAKVSKVKPRQHPDGTVHYTITSTDEAGKKHDDEYRADGALISAH